MIEIDPDTLHYDGPNELRWSRTNFQEAMPGVVTPISWSFWGTCSEESTRRIMSQRLGVFSPHELTDTLADTMTVLFYGRAAANLDLMARAVSRIPGSDLDAFERQFFGKVTSSTRRPERRLRPLVWAPTNLAAAPRRVRGVRRMSESFWRTSVAVEPTELTEAVALAHAAREKFTLAMTEHGFASMVGQTFYQQLATLAADIGHPGLELQLAARGAGLEETQMADDLRAVAAGRLGLQEVVARYGFHGPNEGEVSSHSWRQDVAPLRAMIERIATSPPSAAGEVAARRTAAMSLLFSRLGPAGRARARVALRGVDTFVPLRETGKTAFLQCLDVGRHAIHAAGRILARSGRLADPGDIAFLTLDEIAKGGIDHGRVEARRRRRSELEALDLPLQWVGQPEVTGAPRVRAATEATLDGIPASSGRHRGTARIVERPDDYERLRPGDVLVCKLTDPSWTPLFAVAGAVVIDVGSALSHGAIVAREMGLPCVIGTGHGTATIPDGAEVEVDGDSGVVIVRAPMSHG